MSSTSTAVSRGSVRGGIPRPVEVVLAGLGLVLASPILAIIALGVLLTSPGPVIFRQPRVGRDGVEFTLRKFRTMRVNLDRHGVTAVGDPRITPIGRWLRLLKLDELPELWNIVRGDMSFVGARPEVSRLVDRSSPAWREVLSARPGLTDPVTLSLRNEEQLMAGVTGDKERFYVDVLQPFKLAGYVEYMRRRTARSDIAVILRTLSAVVVPGLAHAPSIDEIRAVASASKRDEKRQVRHGP